MKPSTLTRPILTLLALAAATAAAQAGVAQPAMRERIDREIAGLVALAQKL